MQTEVNTEAISGMCRLLYGLRRGLYTVLHVVPDPVARVSLWDRLHRSGITRTYPGFVGLDI